MKAKEMRNLSSKELQKDLNEHREKLLKMHVDLRSKEVKNVREIRKTKKTIARILTVIAEQNKVDQGEKS